MKLFPTKISKTLLASAALPIAILGINPEEVKSEESKGIYLTGNYGTSSFTSADWKATVKGLSHKGDLNFDEGTGWEAGLGYDFGTLRTEVSYTDSLNDIESINAVIDEGILSGTAVSSSASGELKIQNIMLNAYLDLPLGKKLTPYLGGGIGGSKLDIDNITVDGEDLESANTWLFGYQAKLGLSLSLNKKLSIFGEGTYSAFSDLGVAGEKYGLESDSDINYRGGFRLTF